MTATHICKQCGRSFEPKRPHAKYDTEECRYQGWIEQQVEAAAQRVKGHALVEVRGQQEEGASAAYLQLAREQICRTLLATDFFTADDLEPLGIPQEYRRSVHGSATGFFSGEEPFMEEAGRRKSERPERKGGKNTIFRITAKGRRELPGLLKGMAGPARDARKRLYGDELTAGVRAGSSASVEGSDTASSVPGLATCPDPGEPQSASRVSAGAPSPQGSDGGTNKPDSSRCASVDSGGVSGEGTSHGASQPSPETAQPHEPLSLLPEVDPEAWAA